MIEQAEDNGTGTAHGLASGSATCSGCGKPLRNIFRIARANVPVYDREFGLSIDTCADCIYNDMDPYFVHYGSGGVPATYLQREPVAVSNEYTCSPDELPERRSIQLEPAPPSRGRYSDGAPGCYARVGGNPSWLQAPRAIDCPRCARPMVFAAQTDHVPGAWAVMIMGFECVPCRIVGTTLERG